MFQITIPVDSVITALGQFLEPFVDGAWIIRAQQNRVAPPRGPFVKLTEILQTPLETATLTNDGDNGQLTIYGPKRIDIQIDFYGPCAGDQCAAVATVYRTAYAPAQFPDGIKPLYCSDGNQGPLITGEEQYESRWTLTASLQYNPLVVLPQQSATALEINTLEDLP